MRWKKKHTVYLSGLAVVQGMALLKLLKPPLISRMKPCHSSNLTPWWTLLSHPLPKSPGSQRLGSGKLCRNGGLLPSRTFSSCWPLTWLTSSGRYRLTAIAVDRSAGPYQNYTVIFVGSEAGVVLKVLAKTSYFSLNDSVLLEEIEAYNHAK